MATKFLRTSKPLKASYPPTELHIAVKDMSAITSRPTLINEDTCRDLVRAWGIDKIHDAVIIEPYAGPGGLTRAMLELPNVKRVIAIEQAWRYLPLLKSLQEKQPKGRLEVVEADPYGWETYSDIKDKGFLDDVPKTPWAQLHPNLFFVSQLPNHRHGDQIFVQWLNCIADEMWLFQHGRFEFGIVASNALIQKITAEPATPMHHKLSVLLEAVVEITPTATMVGFSPAGLHFHHPRGDPANFGAMKLTPHAVLPEAYDALENIARHMFVTKGHPWQRAISCLAPGAENLIPKILADPAVDQDPLRPVNALTRAEWAVIARVFNAWPFRPSTLFDDGGFSTYGDVRH